MNRKAFCFLLGILYTTIFYAQEKALPEINDSIWMQYNTDEVVIVAFKSNNKLSVQPVSASLLSATMIEDRNINTIKDLTAHVPNFFMPDYGSKLTSPVYIRGIGSRINSPSVGLYVDGIPYFDRSSFDFNLNDIERIEILRGPQGTIYGRNTMGGIINVYTKSPFRHKESNLHLSAGSYNNYKAGASHIGNINNKIGYSFSANYLHSGGYFDNKYTGKKADPMDIVSGRIRLGWEITPQLIAYLTSAYEYSDQNGYPYGVYNPDRNWVDEVNYDAPSFYRRHMSNNGLTLEYTTSHFKLGSQTSFQYLDGIQGIDQDFTPEDQYYVTFTHRQKMHSHETNIRSIGENRYKWQFGLFGFHQGYDQTNDIEYRQLDRRLITNVDNPAMGFALYHQSTLDDLFIKGLSATIGIRYDWEKIKMENNSKTVSTDTNIKDPIFGKDIYSQVTPKFSLQYDLPEERIVYASASKGYKAGGFNTSVEEEEDRIFKPEYSWSYEVGMKGRFFNNLLSLDLSLFNIDWTDQQISQKRATEQGFKLRNAGKSTSRGFEITTQVNPLKDLNFQLNYGYTHAKFDKYLYDEDKEIDYSGNYLPLVPRNTFSVIADHTIRLNKRWLDKIKLNVQYTGLGKLYWSDDNNSVQDYYNTLNAKVAFILKGLSLDIWARNITNEKYITYYFESMGNKFAQRGKPFSLGVDVNLTF